VGGVLACSRQEETQLYVLRGRVIRSSESASNVHELTPPIEMPNYLFDPQELQEIANLGVGLPIQQRWDVIHQALIRRHGNKIAPRLRWVFNSAGNVVCQLALVYASLREYVAFFGTPIGASGFSGRYHWADVWDLMVSGKMLTFLPGQLEATEYGPGDTAYLQRGEGKSVIYVGSTWMIDYARGLPITMLPFGVIAPALFATLDYASAAKQMVHYARLVLRSMFRQ